MTSTEIDALGIMDSALTVFRLQMQTPVTARERAKQLKELARLFLTGAQVIVSEAEGDPEYILINPVLSDIDSAFCDAIDREDDEAEMSAFTQRDHGTYHVVAGRVA